MTPPVTNAQLADRIEVLTGSVYTAIDGIKEVSKGFTSFQVDYEKRHAELQTKVKMQESEIQVQRDSLLALRDITKAQSTEIESLKNSVKDLQVSVKDLSKVIGWFSKIFWALFIPLMLGTISFLLGILTHTIVITFPK